MKTFIKGNTYTCKSICDSKCTWTFKVIDKTDKTVTLDNGKRYKIHAMNDEQFIYPLGRYSLAPVLRA